MTHALYALLQSGPPPLETNILLLSKQGGWFLGDCRQHEHGIIFHEAGTGWTLEDYRIDRWMLLPNQPDQP